MCQLTHTVFSDNDTEGQRMANPFGEATMLINFVHNTQQWRQDFA